METFLEPVLAKLNRARNQVQALTASIGSWASAHPIQMRCELRDGRLGYKLVQIDYSEPPPTVEWGLQVGECAHNLRSALDNLAYALARLREDPPKRPNAVAFPIYREQDKFAQKGRRNIDQLPDDAAARIERMQPFQRDGGEAEGTVEQDPLLFLQELNNADKHRVPSIVLIAPDTLGHQHEVEFQSESDAALNAPPDVTAWTGLLAPGVVLFEMRTKHPLVRVKGHSAIRAVVAVEILGRPKAVERLLNDLGTYTAMVVEQFRGFFAPNAAA